MTHSLSTHNTVLRLKLNFPVSDFPPKTSIILPGIIEYSAVKTGEFFCRLVLATLLNYLYEE